ncbi:capsular biosynthesis protein [Psychromonas sp. MB-3u-54]|uniref:glycosyltransferase family 61 protein n=1 Tax=Psychromonas sp. MB-3u-54 TaxID=2058319 RepID=UPI000C31DF6B|nr:glycosyltransferase family 61 protein [Psychromonas sp. MB-3u-54]PKH01854.1 capsular biosynthesis protein [Psychromonas sp. MB-3u-54]
MKKLVRQLLKSIYPLLPEFLRDTITSNKIYLLQLMTYKLKVKKVKLVAEPELLGANCKFLIHKIDRYEKVNSPILYVDKQECKRSSIEGKLPDTKVIYLENVSVLGATDAIISDDKMYHQELSFMGAIHDLKQPDIFTISNCNSYDYQVKAYGKDTIAKGVVVSLLKEHSINYYHWITEVMPKLIEIMTCLNEEEHNITILIDENIPSQSISIIDKLLAGINSIEYNIVKVKKGELVFCQSLIYCTPLWISLDNTRYLPNPKKEFFVSVESLKKVKSKITQATKNKTDLTNRKIYLQRENNRLRKITNILEVERLLYKYGFDFVDPGSLDFEEQYNLFSQADIIIGASGAAFTNLLFMKSNSKAISLYPSAQSTNYYVFQPLADVSNVELIHFLTIPNDNSNSVHGDALVNIPGLESLLDKKLKT